ncbi:MAG: hypothetical protein LBH01_00760 [Verrucomicrobiales bacterium]|jgi:hypothetical protein|nr:hypothetical protein [Verrucomicrobiales bacterium]
MIRDWYQRLSQFAYEKRIHIGWCWALGLLAACLLGKYLFSDDMVLSKEGTDVSNYFYYSYTLAWDGLSQGHLVKWNPYVYGGQPFLGPFQSALLYPVTWILTFLPVSMALNWTVFLHLWLLGTGMYAWSVYRGLKPLAAFAVGVAMMLGGPFFVHVYAGHIPNICSMAWAPFVFWGIDGWLRQRHGGWLLLSAAAAAMQIYAGHPQYFYYTAITAGLYSLIFLFDANHKKSAAVGLLLIYPLAMLLAAAQLLPGLSATSESVRMGGANYEFASMFAFPFENLFTLLSPWFFGDMEAMPYWGKCYLWEMQLYCGIGILLLAVFGFCQFGRQRKFQFLILFGILTLLAVGSRTPLYQVLYHVLPGYSMFRGTSKFIFFLALFGTLIGGHGLSLLIEGKRPFRWLAWTGIGLGAVLALIGLSLQGQISGWFNDLLQTLGGSESYLAGKLFAKDANALAAQNFSAHSLFFSSVWFCVFGSLFLAIRRWRQAIWIFVAMIVLDSILFIWPVLTGFSVDTISYQQVAEVLKKNPGDYRTLNLFNPEANVMLRSEGLWGYDPFVLKRYAEFMFFSQKQNPDMASQNLQITENSPLFALLRGRIAFVPKQQGLSVEPLQEQIFPRFFVVSKYRVLQKRDEILQTLMDPSFNPRKEAILEEEPNLPPDPGEPQYQIRLLSYSSDHWTIEILTAHSAILMMTDAYSKDWKVIGLPGSVQTNYHLLPADYALRGIPLAPGRHVITIEYQPGGFWRGLLISQIAWLLLIGGACIPSLRARLDLGKLTAGA